MLEVKRARTTPGEILREEFLEPMGISQKKLADHIGCDFKVINRIVNGKSSVTPEMAVKLASALNTTPQFWLNAQEAVDLYEAYQKLRRRRQLPEPLLKENQSAA